MTRTFKQTTILLWMKIKLVAPTDDRKKRSHRGGAISAVLRQ
jgi:hypothetical protein